MKVSFDILYDFLHPSLLVCVTLWGTLTSMGRLKVREASQCLGRSSPIGWGFSKERSNVIVLNTKAIVKSSQWKALFQATARLP
jgi:hypothetical protein